MNVFVVREIKDAFETVKDLEKIGVKSKSLPITKCNYNCLLYTSPSPRDNTTSRMPSSA